MVRKSALLLIMALVCLTWQVPVKASDASSGQILGGSANAPVRIEVFSDFQCSACREFYLGTIRQILQEYSSRDKVCVIYHEFPLQAHKFSKVAARYAEATARLGTPKLLPVMDSIFKDQAQWSQDGRVDISVAKALSREDFRKLKAIMQDSSINLAIEREIDLGTKLKIKSTPTMLLSYLGKQQRVEGLVTYLVLKGFIDNIVK